MPRTYKHKRPRNYNTFDKENMEKAVRAVNAGKLSLGKAAKEFNVKKSTLHDRVKKNHMKTPGEKREG